MQKWEYVTVPLLVHATKQILDNWGRTAGNWSPSSPDRTPNSWSPT